MEVQVNYLAVVLAALSTMAVGSLWYAPQVFGRRWEKLAKLDRKNMADPKVATGLTLMASLLSAYVLAHVTWLAYSFFGGDFLMRALVTAFWAWLGFTAARIIAHDAFENRPRQLTLLTVSHELVTFMVMALVIGLLKP